jgi:enoyl-CoA hydratase/carnithine racemase
VTPPQYLQDLICGGATYAPVAGIARGLVDEVVDPGLLLDRAIAAAQALAALSPAAFALTKRQIRQPALARVQGGGILIDTEVAKIWAAPETLDRVRDYVSRTFKKA